MACITLSCNVERILNQVPWVVLEKVIQEIHKVVCSLWGIVDDWVAVVD